MALKPSAKIRGLRGAETLRRDQFYSSAWLPALRAAGLAEDRFKFHACRHWCASTLLAEGAPITAVAGHLGDTVETCSRVRLRLMVDEAGSLILDAPPTRECAWEHALMRRDPAARIGWALMGFTISVVGVTGGWVPEPGLTRRFRLTLLGELS